ncbi:MAG: hypothetical protein RI955_673 [Bacteroidota bacterium]
MAVFDLPNLFLGLFFYFQIRDCLRIILKVCYRIVMVIVRQPHYDMSNHIVIKRLLENPSTSSG